MYKIRVNTNKKVTEISPSLYGLFFEDINRAGDGGIYAELVRNRAFDDGIIPQGCTYNAEEKTITSPTGWKCSFDSAEAEGIAGWSAKAGAVMKLTDKATLHENRKRAMEVNFCGGVIENDGFQGIFVEEGKGYRFYMFAKSEQEAEVTVRLASVTGQIYAEKTFRVFGDYTRYECELVSEATDFDARLVISSQAEHMVTFGFVSLFPKDTYMGRENGLRKSLVERLLRLNPAFLRFPGGCIVEGFTKETAFRFADTIGSVWERKPHWLLWSYMTTNGLGFHEYLQFCEDAGMDAMYVFNCGMTCQGRNPDYFDEALVEEYYEDTVHAILYATAPADTEWGAKRAENGHPKPFEVLKYIEIGNENWGPEYFKRYQLFYDRLKKEFPQFIYISTDHTERVGLPTEMVDEHFYSDPVFFATNATLYDGLDRNGIDIYCGEYAATIGCKEGILHGALGEAAFLTGIERNQDKVRMTSYAPLFQNVAYKEWEPDMILFNNHEDYVIPSYYMLEMFANNRGSYVCDYTVETEYDKRREFGGFGIVVNDGIRFQDVKVDGNIGEQMILVEGNASLVDGEVFTNTGSAWGVVGDIKKNTQHFSAILQSAGDRICIRFWDVACRGEDQNHYDWILENGTSRVEHYNGWSCENICKPVDCTMSAGKNTVEIIAKEDSFQVMLNGAVIHEKTLQAVPHLTAVCTVEEETGESILKLVNMTEKALEVEIVADVEMEEEAVITTLTSDSYGAKNTFADKERVKPYTETVIMTSDKFITIKPRSVNIIRQKRK
ncbi:MAG: hypothetical protein IJ405_08655 [Lachnospiraceae bacterium]|nr:hypothetical protein [Lachnospiraceae bacterium]MBQ7782076.1 hypothetical protein [Lachnospiraceae bacterium]